VSALQANVDGHSTSNSFLFFLAGKLIYLLDKVKSYLTLSVGQHWRAGHMLKAAKWPFVFINAHVYAYWGASYG
jgi:hypothetical protein